MDRYLLVMLGAALGGASRYALTTVITEKFGGNFPLGTFLVNISGSFMIGAVMTIISDRLAVHPNWRLLLVVGLLGGYTTFPVWSLKRCRQCGVGCRRSRSSIQWEA